MKETSSYNKQQKLTIMQFFLELPNFIAVLLSAIFSGSLIVWLDLIDSLGGIFGEGVVMTQSRKLSKDLKFKYNYGVGKVEALTTILCEGVAIGGLICIMIISIIEIINPAKPSDLIIYVVILKIINVLLDLFFVYKQYKIKKESSSKIIKREFVSNIGALAFDVATLLSLLFIWLFRNFLFSWYIAPILSLVIAIVFTFFYSKHIKNAIDELSDKTLPENLQFKILKVLAHHQQEYEYFDNVKSHYNGSELIIDIVICFFDDTPYKDIAEFQKTLQEELTGVLGECVVSLII
ncbi:MAG: cation transporter [Bacilli bacterium]|nr:cation transporter [Bacilli bacterium]